MAQVGLWIIVGQAKGDQQRNDRQRRVEMARALAVNPKILFLDEPTAGQDGQYKEALAGVLADIAAMGVTPVVVTHDLGFARQVAHRICFCDEGRIVEPGAWETCTLFDVNYRPLDMTVEQLDKAGPAGGSAGAILGPGLAAMLSQLLRPTDLLLASAILLGLASAGVRQVLYMPDYYGIVQRALDALTIDMDVSALVFDAKADQRDSVRAAEILAEKGAGCIVTLGGDGTNRVVAKGACQVPILPVSTGTNNVFPYMIEGTIAGLAAGLIATGKVS